MPRWLQTVALKTRIAVPARFPLSLKRRWEVSLKRAASVVERRGRAEELEAVEDEVEVEVVVEVDV